MDRCGHVNTDSNENSDFIHDRTPLHSSINDILSPLDNYLDSTVASPHQKKKKNKMKQIQRERWTSSRKQVDITDKTEK